MFWRQLYALSAGSFLSTMKKILLFTLIILSSLNARAEFDFGLDNFSLDDLSLKRLTDMEGWTPRYAFLRDDVFVGKTHYAGVSFFKKSGAEYSGPTFRVGFGEHGERVNLAYTSGFSFMSVDMGLSYMFINKGYKTEFDNPIEGIGLELGLRLWVVQLIMRQSERMSYVALAYGF